jgi:[ribosomal protein S5]-alanine N-acetyltransferase
MIDFFALTEQLERVHTTRLALRPVSLSDAWPLFLASRNPLFNQHLMWNQPESNSVVLERVDKIVEASRRGQLTALSAVVKTTGEWVSLYRFQKQLADPTLIEMGIWTHDKFWGGHFSLELTKACVDSAFTCSDIPSLVAASSPLNKGSYRVLAHCGLLPTHMAIRQTEAGTEAELQEFRITREQWLLRRGPGTFEQVPTTPIPRPHSLVAAPGFRLDGSGLHGGPSSINPALA